MQIPTTKQIGCTSSRYTPRIAIHALTPPQITIACTSSLYPQHADHSSFLAQHGDAVRVIALTVLDCRAVFARALEHGARVVREPSEARDEFGHVITAEIATFGDVIHRFVERKDYTGTFMNRSIVYYQI